MGSHMYKRLNIVGFLVSAYENLIAKSVGDPHEKKSA